MSFVKKKWEWWELVLFSRGQTESRRLTLFPHGFLCVHDNLYFYSSDVQLVIITPEQPVWGYTFWRAFLLTFVWKQALLRRNQKHMWWGWIHLSTPGCRVVMPRQMDHLMPALGWPLQASGLTTHLKWAGSGWAWRFLAILLLGVGASHQLLPNCSAATEIVLERGKKNSNVLQIPSGFLSKRHNPLRKICLLCKSHCAVIFCISAAPFPSPCQMGELPNAS